MVSVSDIIWLSKEAKEAEVLITDGIFLLSCFSHPCELKKNNDLRNHIRAFEPVNVFKSYKKGFKAIKLPTAFGYYIRGKVEDRKLGIVRLGNISIKLDIHSLPGDVKDKDYIAFECDRLDI